MSPARESRLRAFAAKLRGLWRGTQADAEVDDEIAEHLQLLTERFVAQGMSRDEAAMAARRRFGNLTMLQEDRRALQTLPAIETLWRDLRHALRTLWRSPGFAAVSIATLGLGIGAATAIFSVIYNVLLAPFPYPDAGRIAFPRIYSLQQGRDTGRQAYTAAETQEIFAQNHVFDATTAASGELVLYTYRGGAEQLFGARVTPGTFEFFGLPALHGRVLLPSDYEPGASPAFVLGYKAWRERFGGDLSMLNQTVVLNGTPRTLVGIMPPRFGWYGADVFIPDQLSRSAGTAADAVPAWFLVGHLKPGVSIEQAEADLSVVAHRLATGHPQAFPKTFTVHVRTLLDSVVPRLRATLYTVLAAVALLLLIACSNVANLMLARATVREKEFALRAVLGAGRARLIQLLIVESLVLAMAGAALGTFLAWGGLQAIVAAIPQDLIPSESVIQLNAPVLTATLATAALTALIFGLAPALQASRQDLTDPLRDSGKGVNSGFRGRRLRDAVIVIEVALSLTLLIGAGLLMRSFVALRELNLGVQPDHVFQVLAQLPADRYKTAAQVTGFVQPLLARLKALPGVVHAAVSTGLPPYSGGDTSIEIAGKTLDQDRQAAFQQVSEEYFRVLRLEFKQGRPFSAADVNEARKVAIVNETFVRQYLANHTVLGRRVRLANLEKGTDPVHDAWFDIVGVVGDVINRGLAVPSAPEVWIPSTIMGNTVQTLMLRTSQDPATLANAVRREVVAMDAGVPLAYPRVLEDWFSERLYAGPRFGFLLMAIFGCVGLILVTVGVYSVLAYSTTQMTHEIGVRMALGAEGMDVLGMVLRGGLRLMAVGIAIGMATSLVFARTIDTQLVGVPIYDPLTLAVATLVLTATAAIACWIPARRAARVDPIVALHCE